MAVADTDAYRRWWGAFCLIVAAGMLVWGETVLEPHLQGMGFMLFWIGCFAFTVAALVIAVLDLRAIRRRSRQEHRQLVEKTLGGLDLSDPSPAPPPANTGKRVPPKAG